MMGWVYGEPYDREKRIHPDLVPYAQLGQLERDKDAVFVALCNIARLWIYDLADAIDLANLGSIGLGSELEASLAKAGESCLDI